MLLLKSVIVWRIQICSLSGNTDNNIFKSLDMQKYVKKHRALKCHIRKLWKYDTKLHTCEANIQ